MSIPEAQFQDAEKLLHNAQRIVIISHRGPDADSVGSNLALRLALVRQWGKEVISACVDPPPENCDHLEDFKSFMQDFDISHADLVISVDCGAPTMLKFGDTKPELFSGTPPLLNIDHHTSNDGFGTVNLVDDNAAAAVQVVYHLLTRCRFRIDRHIATALLSGLYFDTGSFMHSNTTPEVLEIAGRLMWKGADFKTIVRKQFRTMTVAQLKTFGTVFERTNVNRRKLTVAALNDDDLRGIGATPEDTNGVIDYLNSVPEGNFSCFLYEDRQKGVKGSFRTRDDSINVSKVAGLFGGGGHKKAAGFLVPGRLRQITPRIKIDS
ncbi:hypothetical protein COV82_05270 [Candidatus Peregrinibacteria bacterium CG11_big_fil_rev_8_21_14_0_20_46_8]|nr:MAG: hypothetical protein COV82_05270 [Candidatus Peregrinibacteria bacterium CG11_big_fil_rev_8_21_14_0_20_46_8]